MIFSNPAIETTLMLGAVYRLPLRQNEGFVRSLLALIGVDLAVPDHTTLSRRRRTVEVDYYRSRRSGTVDIVLDSTGLKFYRQVCRENEVDILREVLSSDHVHMLISVPLKFVILDLVRKMKGRSSHKVQREFPSTRKGYWGRPFWERGYLSITNGVITEDIVLQCLEEHTTNPTDTSR